MISKDEAKGIFNDLIEQFIAQSPFFREWNPGRIDRSAAEKFLVTFDFLVKSFPILIAAGAARMEDEETRVGMAVNLFQESGEGDISRTHHAIYRKFLTTAGIPISATSEDSFARKWRENLSNYMREADSSGAVLGALAAGEFLAQPALTRIYTVIQPLYPQADQEYFTKHLQLETEHVEEITSMIVRQAQEGGLEEVEEGFKFGLSVWNAYFNSLAQFIMAVK